MGKRGPPKLPSKIMKLHGNPSGRPMNDAEPEPEPGTPPKPAWFGYLASAEWDRMAPLLLGMGVLTLADGSALEAYVVAYGRWRECEDVLRREGQTVEITSQANGTYVKARPEFAMARTLYDVVKAYQREFGLTPSSRTGIKATTTVKPKGRSLIKLHRGA